MDCRVVKLAIVPRRRRLRVAGQSGGGASLLIRGGYAIAADDLRGLPLVGHLRIGVGRLEQLIGVLAAVNLRLLWHRLEKRHPDPLVIAGGSRSCLGPIPCFDGHCNLIQHLRFLL